VGIGTQKRRSVSRLRQIRQVFDILRLTRDFLPKVDSGMLRAIADFGFRIFDFEFLSRAMFAYSMFAPVDSAHAFRFTIFRKFLSPSCLSASKPNPTLTILSPFG
jgi:hypothetical protein